jgi:hypothetical protein
MWTEVLTSLGLTSLLGGSYLGLYKLGWYVSRKEQENKIISRLSEIDKIIHDDKELKEYKTKLEEHLIKLQSHNILWKKDK